MERADVSAERAICGCALLYPDRVLAEASALRLSDFSDPGCREVWRAISELHSKSSGIDAASVAASVRRRGSSLDALTWIDALTSEACVPSGVGPRARKIATLAAVRRASRALDAARTALDGGADPDEWLASLAETVGEAATSRAASDHRAVPLGDLTLSAIDQLGRGAPPGVVETGLAAIDRGVGGLQPGLVTILAGRPGSGKSTLALNVAYNAARAGRRVLLYSLEDTGYFVALRTIARAAGVELSWLSRRQLSADEHKRILAAHPSLSVPLLVCDSSGLDHRQIAAIAQRETAREHVDLVVVDHLQDLGGDGDTYDRTTASARGCAQLAKTLDVPVLLVSQLSRAVEQRNDKRPTLSDLRDSGRVEEVARVVWLLYRPAYYDAEADPHDLDLIVAKNSHGQTGRVRLRCDLPTMTITDPQEV